MIVSSDGYSLVYYQHQNKIVIKLPPRVEEKLKLKSSDEAAILTMVKIIMEERK